MNDYIITSFHTPTHAQFPHFLEKVGVRSRSELPLAHGLEFLEPIVASCLQWDPNLRPSSKVVRRNFSQQQMHHQPLMQPFTTMQSQSQSNQQTIETTEPATAVRRTTPPHHQHDDKEHKNSKTEDASSEKDVVSMPSRGNPKYGKCTVDGCTSYKIRKSFESCWAHLPLYLPNEIKVSAAMQRAGLLEWTWPCDLVAAVVHAKAALKLGLLPFTIISFLKVPGAISRFLIELGSASAVNAEVLLRGLQAACAGCKNCAMAS